MGTRGQPLPDGTDVSEGKNKLIIHNITQRIIFSEGSNKFITGESLFSKVITLFKFVW